MRWPASFERKGSKEDRRERARLEGIVETAMDAVISTDPKGRIVVFNRSAEEMFMVKADEVKGRSLERFIPARFRYQHRDGFNAFRDGDQTARSFTRPLIGVKADGTEFSFDAAISKVESEGEVVMTIVCRDATARLEHEAERERILARERRLRSEAQALAHRVEEARAVEVGLRAQAQEANEAKSSFLAMMSHELRTPLNAISGYVQLIEMGLHGPVTQAQAQALKRVEVNQARLLSLVNEILDYAKLEAGQMALTLESVDLSNMAAACEVQVLPQLLEKGLKFSDDELAQSGIVVRADPARLQQIVVNLLSNSVKFTERGGAVELVAYKEGRFGMIAVVDSGCGVPAEQMEAIFDPFVQVHAQGDRSRFTKRDGQGTGLGLAISRDLARAMGGSLSAESTVGAGSVFTLKLPLAENGWRSRNSGSSGK